MAWRSACGRRPTSPAEMRDHRGVVEVAEILRRSAGSATFAQLRASVSGRAIRTALAAGVIRRIAKGVYALPPPSNAIAAARARGGVVSHQSAAVLHGLDVRGRDRPLRGGGPGHRGSDCQAINGGP
jgi:hypothetical protein